MHLCLIMNWINTACFWNAFILFEIKGNNALELQQDSFEWYLGFNANVNFICHPKISACNKHVIFSLAWLGRNWKMAAVCMHTVKTLIEIIGYKVYKTEKESQNSPLWGTDYTHFWVWCSDIVLLFVSQIMNNGSFRQDPMKILVVTRELKYLYYFWLGRVSWLI